MKLSIQEIEHIASLARLELTEEEKAQYAEQLSSVLSYMDVLQEVDTNGVEETTQVTGLTDVSREDIIVTVSDDDRTAIISQFPERSGDQLLVKKVFSE